MFLVIILFGLFASLFTLSKNALMYAEPFFLISFRMVLAGLLLVSYSVWKNKIILKQVLNPSTLFALIILGVVNIYIANIAEIWGIMHMSSYKVCLIYSLSPFVSAFLAYILLQETMNKRKWMGMTIGFLGLAPILITSTQNELQSGTFWLFSFAELSVMIAVFASSYGWILLKKIIVQHQVNTLFVNGFSMLVGGVLGLLHSYLSQESWQPVPIYSGMISPFLLSTLVMLIISNLICYNLYGLLLKKYSVTFMSFSGLVTPLFASYFGWFFLGEKILPAIFLAMPVFAVGLFIFHTGERS